MSKIVNEGRNLVYLKDREAFSPASLEGRERPSSRGWKEVQL